MRETRELVEKEYPSSFAGIDCATAAALTWVGLVRD